MALMFEYKPGADLTQPWPFAVVRSQPGYRFTNLGTVAQVGANVLRDNHYVGGIRTALFEPSAINSVLQSQTLNTTWTKNQTTVTSDAIAAPDGTTTADKIVETAVTNVHNVDQTITIAAKEFVAISGFFKAGERTSVRLRTLTNGTDELTGTVNLTTGAFSSGPSANGNAVLIGSKIIALANGWYWVAIWGQTSTTSVATTATITVLIENPGDSYAGDGTSGLYAWGMQFERNGTSFGQAATSYLPTTTAVSSARGADSISTPWPFKVQPMWCYASWYDLGMCQRAQSSFAVTITPATAADPQWVGLFGGVGSDVRSSWISGAGSGGPGASNRNSATVAVSPVYGDLVETYARVLGDGSTLIAARRNGGAITVGAVAGPAGGTPFVDFAASPLLWLGYPGETIAPLIGLTVVRIGADPTRVTTLAQAAAA